MASVLEAEEEKLLACIHCGLCLQACPTYVQTGDENDSPRGRVYLMRAVREERLALNSTTFTDHINRCLGCRACEPACPSGVQYGQLLEAARSDLLTSKQETNVPQRLLRFVLRNVWSRKWLLSASFDLSKAFRESKLPRLLVKTRLARFISPRLEFALELLDRSGPAKLAQTLNKTTDRTFAGKGQADDATNSVCLFKGCVMEGLFGRVNRATRRVLEVNGYPVRSPQRQGCCGALHAHAGDLAGARELAKRNIEAFEAEPGSPIITNAGGCGAMLVSYAHLLEHDHEYADRAVAFSARVRDVSQQLASNDIVSGASMRDQKVTYDASCHLIYGQHAGSAPLSMMKTIPGLELVPLEGAEMCCGGAGVYNLLEPDLSSEILKDKLAHIEKTGAAVLATGNPGCHMQIGAGARLAGMKLEVVHPVELLDASYRNAGFYENKN